MGFSFFQQARRFLDAHPQDPELVLLRQRFAQALSRARIEEMLTLYDQLLERAEALFWTDSAAEADLERLQALYREREQLLNSSGGQRQHRFLVVIPVADRPRQLEACLQSLWAHVHSFGYGGGGVSIRVLVAEDSRDPAAVARHETLARRFTEQGLEVTHFHPREQQALLASLPPATQQALAGVLGTVDGPFQHKGASRMRNITYLYLARLAARDPGLRFFFIDSDETFQVLRCSGEGGRELAAVNHFHHLDRILSGQKTAVLTGKVVGDPPVAPAVMAGNFMEDVGAFLHRLAEEEAEAPCPFHGEFQGVEGAAYHDMAELFGFEASQRAHDYRCRLASPHDRLAVMGDFAARLDRFFDGEHPTRITCYRHQPVSDTLQPARTVYTGNYVLDGEGLRHFIPFSGLRLRMAGPVLGRLLRAELGERFRSANLPLLHRRAPEITTGSEFRAGVERRSGRVDLSDEFERQFYGDLMLFTIERLVEVGYPNRMLSASRIRSELIEVMTELDQRYGSKQAEVQRRLALLQARLDDPRHWWHRTTAASEPLRGFRRFLSNMSSNFGPDSPPMVRIRHPELRERRIGQMVAAIQSHPREQEAWVGLLERMPDV